MTYLVTARRSASFPAAASAVLHGTPHHRGRPLSPGLVAAAPPALSTGGEQVDDLLAALQGWIAAYGPWLAAAAIVLAAAVMIGRDLLWRWRHRRWAAGARMIVVHVPPQVDPSSAASFWANLVGLLHPRRRRLLFGQPHLVFEYSWTGQELQIGVWVPGAVPTGLVERAIEAAWPAARTRVQAVRPPIAAKAAAAGGALQLAQGDHLPLKVEHPVDPLRALLGAAAGLAPGQQVVVQVLARPVTGRRLRRAYQAAAALRGASTSLSLGWLFDLLTPGPSARPAAAGQISREHPERAAQVQQILAKAAAPRFETAIRYAAATIYRTDPDATRAWLRGRAHAIASAFAVFAGPNHLDRHRLGQPAAVLAGRRLIGGGLLSVPELAALAHLPYDSHVPGLSRAAANAVPPSPAVSAAGGKVLGEAETPAGRPVALMAADARHHLHVLGATGVGKSTLLGNLMLADVTAGRAVVAIDPRGDLITDLLDRLPDHAAARVQLIDPDTLPPPALGVLSGGDPDLTADNLVGIFHRIFADSWGPRTDDILRSAILTLQRSPGTTLADIPRLLTDDPYRLAKTRRLHPSDDAILAGFWSWYAGLSGEARAHAIGPVMNKLRHFLLRPFVRAVVGTPGPGLNAGRLLDHGGILLVRIPKGVLGEEAARLLGSFVLAKIWETAAGRARRNQHTRIDAALYIDEAHNFLTLPHGVEEMLAEARGYRLSVVLAHQNLAQLPASMREAVSANARNKIYFAASPEDARHLARHTLPTLTEHDLTNLGRYTAAARLLVGSQETPAFTFTTRPLPDPAPERAQLIRHAARGNAQATHRRVPPSDPRTILRPDSPLDGPTADRTVAVHSGGDDPPPPTSPGPQPPTPPQNDQQHRHQEGRQEGRSRHA